MATCIECGQGWNSWGSCDDFCSDPCENTRQTKDEKIAQQLLNCMNSQQIKQLDHLLFSATGINAMKDMLRTFGHLLKK